VQPSSIFWRVVLLGPAVLVFSIFVLWPLLESFAYAFTDWNGFSSDYRNVGLDNFLRIASDPEFLNAALNTAAWMVAALVLPALLGLGLALLLSRRVPAAGLFKSIFYLPICLSGVIVGQIWIWIYQPDWGLLDTVIAHLLGQRHFKFAWLAEPSTALGSVIVAWSWVQTGLSMVIFLAGLTAIPRELLEAADVEGVSRWRQTLHIVLPMLRPATVVVVALSVINALKGFDLVYVMTAGGPFHSTNTLAFFMYEEAFKKYRIGYGSAIAVVLFLIALSIILVYFRQLRKLDEIYD
jgi:multiple sugar transport system permease protein/raffinose/stachyose/melibiose transport system permease protein